MRRRRRPDSALARARVRRGTSERGYPRDAGIQTFEWRHAPPGNRRGGFRIPMKKLLLALAILNRALVAAPLIALLPFIAQTPAMLAIARDSKILSPVVSLASAALALAVVWRYRRTWVPLALILTCAVLSRVNYVEWIFEPATDARTAAIGDFHDVRDSDMVI